MIAMSRRPIPPARALAMLAVLALLAGCSTLSPYSRLTKLDLARWRVISPRPTKSRFA